MKSVYWYSLQLTLPDSGAIWFFTTHRKNGALVKDPQQAMKFPTKENAQTFLDELRVLAKGAGDDVQRLADMLIITRQTNAH